MGADDNSRLTQLQAPVTARSIAPHIGSTTRGIHTEPGKTLAQLGIEGARRGSVALVFVTQGPSDLSNAGPFIPSPRTSCITVAAILELPYVA